MRKRKGQDPETHIPIIPRKGILKNVIEYRQLRIKPGSEKPHTWLLQEICTKAKRLLVDLKKYTFGVQPLELQ